MVDFTVPEHRQYDINDFVIKLKIQGQMGDFYINGKDRWHFGLLLDPGGNEFLIGEPFRFQYSNDWQQEIQSGDNTLEYVPRRQTGAPDEKQHITIEFFLGTELLSSFDWRSEELVDNERRVIRFNVEQQGLTGSDEPQTPKEKLVVRKYEYGPGVED